MWDITNSKGIRVLIKWLFQMEVVMFVGIGIFALILLTVSWIGAKIDDKKCMSKPSYLLDDERLLKL